MSNEQDILDNAPQGAEYISKIGYLWNDGDSWFIYEAATEEWLHLFFHEHDELELNIRSLADIKRIFELEVENKTLSMKGTGLAEFKEYYKNLVYDATGITSTTRLIVEYKKLLSLKEQGE